MNALRSTVARASIRATQRVQKRQMGSGAAAPEWTGIDKIVRDKFPEDYQGEFHQVYVGRVDRICSRLGITWNKMEIENKCLVEVIDFI